MRSVTSKLETLSNELSSDFLEPKPTTSDAETFPKGPSRECQAKSPYKRLRLHLVGVAPLIMHNGALSDPLNQYSKAIKRISSKRHKVDSDYEEMARLEYHGGLYLHQGRPCIPGFVVEAALVRGGRRS
jgi:hypothetical protein